MKKISNAVWGVLLVALGVFIALDAMNVLDINFFFKGWWTLFIIIPSLVGLVTEREKAGNIIGLAIGIALLLAARDILEFEMLSKLILPAIIIVIGANLFIKTFSNKEEREMFETAENNGEVRYSTAIFSGKEEKIGAEKFEGAELTAIFGAIDLDLRGAIIEKDCVIKVAAIFGGVDIIAPENVNLKVSSNSIFGGVTNKIKGEFEEGRPTVYISAFCIFGGAEIK